MTDIERKVLVKKAEEGATAEEVGADSAGIEPHPSVWMRLVWAYLAGYAVALSHAKKADTRKSGEEKGREKV